MHYTRWTFWLASRHDVPLHSHDFTLRVPSFSYFSGKCALGLCDISIVLSKLNDLTSDHFLSQSIRHLLVTLYIDLQELQWEYWDFDRSVESVCRLKLKSSEIADREFFSFSLSFLFFFCYFFVILFYFIIFFYSFLFFFLFFLILFLLFFYIHDCS